MIRAGGANVDAATAGIYQAGVRPNPEISVEVENFTGTGPYSDFGSTEYTLTYSQRLESSKKRSARVAFAQADRDVAHLEGEKAKLDVTYSVRQAWIGILQAKAEVENAERRLVLASDIGSIVQRRVKAARDPLAAGMRAENQIAEARTELDQANRALATAKRALVGLWGGGEIDFTVDPGEFSDLSRSYPTGAQAFSADAPPPDIASFSAQVQRAEQSYAVEKSKTKQDPVVGIGVRRFEDGNDFAGLVSVSIPLALFDTNRGNINRAMAERQQAEWILAEARRRYAAQLQSLLDSFHAAKAEATTIRNDLIPRAQSAVDSVRDGYNRGAFNYLDVADTEKSLADLRARENTALAKLQQASASIDRLTGQFAGLPATQGNEP